MESLLIPLFLLFLFIRPSLSVHVCKPESCSEDAPPIRFPFWLKGKQKERCGYPGFQLSCNAQRQTVLKLPRSGEFVVKWINYTSQTIYIDDPSSCLPRRFSSFNVSGTPFRQIRGKKYTFFNCSLSRSDGYWLSEAVPLFCTTDSSYLVLATKDLSSFRQNRPPSCKLIPNVSVPLQLLYVRYISEMVSLEAFGLTWSEPACRSCELNTMYCGFNSDTGLETDCANPSSRGLPRSAKYGITIGVGIPGLICLIGFVCYAFGKVRDFGQRRNPNTELSTAEMNPPTQLITVTGLDARTIESYPKVVIGESFHLPKSGDGTCPICLSEYQPKETLRSIPECNHYFHANCLDEWLKLNGTCPLCRNSPESTAMTPCSSMSSTVSS